MLKKVYVLLLCCLCCGCVERRTDSMQVLENAEIKEIYERISRLNVITVTPGADLNTETAQRLKNLGLIIPNKKNNKLYDLLKAINSEKKIIWSLRGGYGTSELISSLKKHICNRQKLRKIFIGFSDITAFNIFISQNFPCCMVIHGPTLSYLDRRKFTKEKFDTLLDILETKINSYKISGLYPLNQKATSVSISGKLTGGNLTIIQRSLKTCWEIETVGKILFLEDVNESPERICRTLYHLIDAGKLSRIKALIFGYFGEDPRFYELFKKFSEFLNVPVYITDQFGHGDKNMPLIYNAQVVINNGEMKINVP
ncbi:MAG: LD-carboxypeptidase [Holosporaceae bacterium]|nr:LD-carboxypeptidase [Holosporaceae bacterium]